MGDGGCLTGNEKNNLSPLGGDNFEAVSHLNAGTH